MYNSTYFLQKFRITKAVLDRAFQKLFKHPFPRYREVELNQEEITKLVELIKKYAYIEKNPTQARAIKINKLRQTINKGKHFCVIYDKKGLIFSTEWLTYSEYIDIEDMLKSSYAGWRIAIEDNRPDAAVLYEINYSELSHNNKYFTPTTPPDFRRGKEVLCDLINDFSDDEQVEKKSKASRLTKTTSKHKPTKSTIMKLSTFDSSKLRQLAKDNDISMSDETRKNKANMIAYLSTRLDQTIVDNEYNMI